MLRAVVGTVALSVWCGVAAVHGLGDDDHGTLGLFGTRDPRVFYAASLEEPVVALSLDDGPDGDTTPGLLAVLRENEARATFFVISKRIPGNEALLHRLVAEGHELGNHMTADEPSIELDASEFEAELLRARDALTPFGEVRWFRPGSGYYDDAMLDIVERHGLRCALGLVYPLDAHLPWSWLARTWIRWRIQPGAVIILHDGGRRGFRTVKTLRKVLPWLHDKGYRVVTLTELARLEQEERARAVELRKNPSATDGREVVRLGP